MSEDLLSWKETLHLLQVSSPTLYAMVDRQELAPAAVQRLGRQERKFFNRQDVERVRKQREGEQIADV